VNIRLRTRDAMALGLVLALDLLASSALAQDLQPPPPMDSSQAQPPPPPPSDQPQQPPPQQEAAPPQGNLAPPPPSSSNPPPSTGTEQKLDESKQEDSGRGLEFLYLNAQGGYAYDALQSINSSNFQMQNTDIGGPMVGAEAGIRLLFFTLGARFRYEMLQPFNFWQLNLVAGFHIQAGKWDPYVSVHGGYSAIGNVDKSNVATTITGALPSGYSSQDIANGMSTRGGNVGIDFGADYYLVRFLSIGVDATFELLFLHRDALFDSIPALKNDPTLQGNPYYSQSGDAAGMGVVVSAHLGIHL